MSTEKWDQVNDLFHNALQLEPSRRAEYIESQCDDPIVKEEVLSLLSAHSEAGDFIKKTVSLDEMLDKVEEDILLPGETIGVYRVVREIGHGGMGAVYLATRADETFEKHVAVKLLKPGMDTAEVLRHFRTERQILADFDHPNIARLLDGGTTQSGLPYLVMEYVEGMEVDAYCDHHRFTIPQRLELFRQICAAVSYAHRHLVIHRDIKPSNILVTSEGSPKLLDFGIAKILHPEGQSKSTATGLRLMTPEYASPEQVLGLPVTTVSDVYSLGVLLYELVTGTLPFHFETRSPLEVARVIEQKEALPASSAVGHSRDVLESRVGESRGTTVDQLRRRLRGDLDNILSMAIRKEPQRRYHSVEQFSEDIRRHLQGLPVAARKDTMMYRMSKFTRRNPFAVGATLLVFIILIAGIITTTWQARKARAEQIRSEYAREFADELRYVESLLLSTYTAPIHDARPTLKMARERLAYMERRMSQAEGLALGSGNNAIGSGYLMLKDFPRAKLHLEKAWNSGYQTPSTGYALGKVFGHLYLQATHQADNTGNNALKEKMLQQAEQEFAQPAIRFLNQARTSAESPAYVEGLIALYKNQHEDALKKASEAMKTSSRPYEVMKLQGDIYLSMARAAMGGGSGSPLKYFELAGKAYAHAAESARSDPDIYLADAARLCRTLSQMTTAEVPLFDQAISACDKAMKINPDSDLPYLCKAESYTQLGINQMYFGSGDPRQAFGMSIQQAEEAARRKETASAHDSISKAYLRLGEFETASDLDPRANLQKSIASSKKAASLSPHWFEAQISEATANFYLSEYGLVRGQDPTEYLTKVIDLYNTDLRDIPKDSYSYNLLGLSHLGLGEFKLKRGLNPQMDFQNAIALYKEGFHRYPTSTYLLENLALVYVALAKYEIASGKNPEKSFQEAIPLYEQSLASTKAWTAFNLGIAYLSRAEYKGRIGQDATEDLQNASLIFRRALELQPNFPPALVQLAATHVWKARFGLSSGKNPALELRKAEKYLKQAKEQDSSSPEFELALGRLYFVDALWRMKERQKADSLFDQAVKAFQGYIQRNPGDVTPHLELATLYRKRAEFSAKDPVAAGKWIDAGLQSIAGAEKINPNNAENSASRGTLLHLRGRISNDSALLREGTEMIQAALQKNPHLQFEYGK